MVRENCCKLPECRLRSAHRPSWTVSVGEKERAMAAHRIRSVAVACVVAGFVLAPAAQANADPVHEDLGGTPATSVEVSGCTSGDIIQPDEYQTTAMPSDSAGPDMVAKPQTTAG
jgi:hypothetical protein